MKLRNLIRFNFQGDVFFLDKEEREHPMGRRIFSSLRKIDSKIFDTTLDWHVSVFRDGGIDLYGKVREYNERNANLAFDLWTAFHSALYRSGKVLVCSSKELHKMSTDDYEKLCKERDKKPVIRFYVYKNTGSSDIKFLYAFMTDKPENESIIKDYISALQEKHPRKYKNLKFMLCFKEGKI